MAGILFVLRLTSSTWSNHAKTALFRKRQPQNFTVRMEPNCSQTTSQTTGNVTDTGGVPLNAEAYANFQEYPLRENLIALQKANFKVPPRSQQQHLEVGCGPGGFTKRHVLDHCSPCLRLVAVDKSSAMIDVAKKTSQHARIYYDVLDIEAGDVESFAKKYGRFSRVYSFLTFHFLKSQKAGYVNVRRLLDDDGECFVTGCLESAILNAWLDVYIRKNWRMAIPDPRKVFCDMHYFYCKKSPSELESQVRKLVADAGLNCLDCQVYQRNWEFPDVQTALDFVFMCFDFEHQVPAEDLSEFREAWRETLTRMRTPTSTGSAFQFTFYTVHATR
ncbi:hypothetical protein V5799_026045 [Amblyomma americanum]|uniref:Methyltransferase type 11 domain-containing protein n=1 Tax=Amblyomma americanum TaxID=6943 RepID=A0AAQ4DJQ5_AMBAM